MSGVLARRAARAGAPRAAGAGPTRFCALAAALRRARAAAVVVERERARALPRGAAVELLRYRARTAALVEPLERLGIARWASSRRWAGRRARRPLRRGRRAAHRLACGDDTPLRTRAVEERLVESLELREALGGQALERALEALIDRLLARPERRGRTLRAADALRAPGRGRHLARAGHLPRGALRCAAHAPRAVPRLALLPRPPRPLRLAAERFGPPDGRAGHAARRRRRGRARAARGCARRSLRCARRPDPMRRCARWRRSGLARPRAPRRADPLLRMSPRGERSARGGTRAVRAARRVRVRAGARRAGRATVDGRPIEHVRESWLVEDRWWTERPLRRRYWEVVSARGRNLVVFHDLQSGELVQQRVMPGTRATASGSGSLRDARHAALRRAALPLGLLVPGRRLAARGARARAARARLRRARADRPRLGLRLDGVRPGGARTAGCARSTAPRST